jgi:osmoprotectant transport system ATP-binding protein
VNPIITFKNVTKRFPDGTEALKNISVVLPTNKLTAIIGPSGCGKTTLMKMINRLEIPTSGDIYIDEESIKDRDPVELRRSIGYVIQQIGLIPHMTIEENIALVPELLKWDKKRQKQRVEELLKLVDLEPKVFKDRYPLELSGGQQQRVGVSRALASDPNIILMDEPFSALDPISREQLQYELKDLQKKIKKTIVFVTHDMDEALDIADNIILMRAGKIEQQASPDDLLQNQVNDFVRDFIGVKRIHRKRDFKARKLNEFRLHFKEKPSGNVQPVDGDITIRQAAKLLDQAPDHRLEVMQDGKILGYIGYRTLLEAALNGSDAVE